MSKNQNVTKKTLDTQHLTKLQEFQDREQIIQHLQDEIQEVQLQIENYKSQTNISDGDFDQYMSLCDHLNELKKQLEKYDKYDEEVDYYINTAPILFQYYDILENGKEVANAPKPPKENSILKYFIQKPVEIETVVNTTNVPQVDRASLLEKYMHVTDSNYLKSVEGQTDKCPHCESVDRNVMLNDGIIYCNSCHTIEYIIIDHERPSYKDPPKEISYFAYIFMGIKVMLKQHWLVAG